MLISLLHLLVGLSGLVILYAALFLHETEEGRLQNRLERLWVEIDDFSRAALSKQAAFLQRVSSMANSALDKIFGARYFSAGAVSASFCFSIGSFMFLNLVQAHILNRQSPYEFYALIIVIVSALIASLPTPWRYAGFPWVLLLLYAVTRSLAWGRSPGEVSVKLSVVFLGGFMSDLLFIALSRLCLRKASELQSGWKTAAYLALNGSLGLFLVVPLIVDTLLRMKGHYVRSETASILVFLAGSNGVTGAISLFLILLSFAALAHLLLWPILERPLYSLQRFGIARNPKLLMGLSITCLLFAWPHSPLIQGITKLIHLG